MLRQRTVTPPPLPALNVPLLESSDLPLDDDWSLLGHLPQDDEDFEISFSPDLD